MKWVNLLLVFIFSFGLSVFFPHSVFAAVSKIQFLTDPQTIAQNTLSEAITFQAQNALGEGEETTETLDLVFTSTSLTGEFLGSTGNPVTKTMSKNTSKRTFYYRDSAQGTFTLTVTATGRDSGRSWTASQSIVVGGESSTIETGKVLGVTASNLGASATTGPTPVSKNQIDPPLEIYAGENRLTTAGSPLSFKLIIRKGEFNSKAEFLWSFGDGGVGGGTETVHTYKYPGIYAVVVNSKSGKSTALSRFSVQVVEPKISLAVKQDYVEITNEGSEEINLFNWKVVSGIKNFIFQLDTIIFPHTSVRFDADLLKFDPSREGEVILFDSLGRKIAYWSRTQEVRSQLEAVQVQVLALRDTVALRREQEKKQVKKVSQTANVVLSEPVKPVATTSQMIIYEASREEKGWWERLIDFFTGKE